MHYSQTAVILTITDFFPILPHPAPAGNLYRPRTVTMRTIFTVDTKISKFKLCKIKFHMLVITHKFIRTKRSSLSRAPYDEKVILEPDDLFAY